MKKFGMSALVLAGVFAGFLGASTSFAAVAVVDICNQIAAYDPNEATQCVGLIGNNTFDANATLVCSTLAQSSGTEAVSCISAISNHAYDSQAVAICSQIAAYDPNTSITCLQTTADKTYTNGTASVCANIAQSSGTGAVACLKAAGVSTPTKPACPAPTVTSSAIKSALQSIDAYDIVTARKDLLQILTQIETCQ